MQKENITYTGALGLSRRTSVGSSSESEASESGFAYMGRSSSSEPELLPISSIDTTLELDGGCTTVLDGLLLLFSAPDFEFFFLETGIAAFMSLIDPMESWTLVRLLYHCPSVLLTSSESKFIRLSFGSTSSEMAVPTIMPSIVDRGTEAESRFEIALRYALDPDNLASCCGSDLCM